MKRIRIAFVLMLVWCQTMVAYAGSQNVVVRVLSPDTTMDSLMQDIGITGELPGGWQLGLRAGSRIMKQGGYAGLDQAYVAKAWSLGTDTSLQVLAGRATPNWSPWRGTSVILSGHAPGMDQVQYTLQQGPARFEKMVARLSGDDRYLLGHRLTLQWHGFTGSVGETAVTNGAFAHNLVTLLPWPFYWTQWVELSSGVIQNDDVNVNAFIQGMYKGKNGLLLGAELLVDDMPQWVGVQQLFQVAGQLHAELPVGLGRLTVQYARVNNFTYAFQTAHGDYAHYGYSLGSPYGPDHDEWHITYDFPRTRLGFTGIGLSARRKGEGWFGDTWEQDGYDASLDKQFLSGVVEHSRLAYAKASYPVGPQGTLHAWFGIGPVQNAKNRLGYDKIHPEGGIELRFPLGPSN